MKIVKNENILVVDVDGTLILPYDKGKPQGRIIDVYDAVTKRNIRMCEHGPNVRLLKEESHRGSHIVVWSRGGYEWASNAVRALDLVTYVDQVMTKPLTYIDDLPVDDWLRYRIFLSPDMQYKK